MVHACFLWFSWFHVDFLQFFLSTFQSLKIESQIYPTKRRCATFARNASKPSVTCNHTIRAALEVPKRWWPATMEKVCADWVGDEFVPFLKGAKMINYRAQKWWIWILSLIGIFRKYPPLFWNQPLCNGWQFSILCVFKTSNNQRVNTNVTVPKW